MKRGVDPGFRVALRRRALFRPRGDDDHRHPGQSLEGVAPVLGLYYRALSGRNAALLSYGNQDDPQQHPDTHTTIRLPPRVARFGLGSSNFAWYKVALTHRAAHYEGGTFDFCFTKPARHFARLRPPADAVERYGHESDLETFFRLFAQRSLAVETFTVLEDLRLDEWAKRRYPGLRGGFEAVQRDAVQERPPLAGLRPRDALAETMMRLSLDAVAVIELPALLHEPVRELARAVQLLRAADATVEDSAEATMRLYCLIVRLPNLDADYGPATPVNLALPPTPIEYPTLWPEPERTHLEGDEVLTATMTPVAYRDRLGSRYTLYRAAGPLDQQAIYRFTTTDKAANRSAAVAISDTGDAERPQSPPEPMEHDHHDRFGDDPRHHDAGELHSHEVSSFIYSEWDHVADAYRRNWCCVRESRIDPAPSARFFDETLHAYGNLVPEIRRQIERLSQEGLRKVCRMQHGDELDLDAAIESLVDMRLGLAPSERVYTSRRKSARDVCVAFLLDLSSSTAEHVESTYTHASDILMSAPGRVLHGRNYRTILDIEKEAMALLMAALDRIGDAYGIYGFSGTGREDVKFLVVKDLDERLSDRVAARLDGIKPLHTTRMGPAIRHAIRKLRGHEARTKLLVLISDGRPFDLDYGQQYGDNAEVSYAIHDTRQALDEARELRIVPFVLTVDPQGNDYLRTLCNGLHYEILQDINQLPARLLSLYHSLTF